MADDEVIITWNKSDYGPWWGYVNGKLFAAVGETAIEGKWLAQVFKNGSTFDAMYCYTASKERGMYFAERWGRCHHRSVKGRVKEPMPPLPRKPKGLEDRS
jgi:hypothetical protein